jgi:agmatine deiminase
MLELYAGSNCRNSSAAISKRKIRMPAEWEPHVCCWMSWAVHREWGPTASKVKRELSEVIQSIARYEVVRVLAPRGRVFREAHHEFSACPNVEVIEAPVDDIWMRDVAPTFALRGTVEKQEVVAIDWNFNGWGGTPARPPRAGDTLAKTAAEIFGVPSIQVSFVGEGGAFVTDGKSTLITTRSCLLNRNRNPVGGLDRQRMIEAELAKASIRQVIWLEGDPGEPITSGHVDGYVLCAPGGVMLAEAIDDKAIKPPIWLERDISVLENSCDATGRSFEVIRLLSPRRRYWNGNPENFAACYVNAYVANGAVISARFGDAERDEAAQKAFAKAFPGREIVMLQIDAIADGGGGVRCLTQPMPTLGCEAKLEGKA